MRHSRCLPAPKACSRTPRSRAFMLAHQDAWRHARMKRSGAELPLCTWSGCGGRLNGVAVVTGKRGGGGDATHCALSRCARINGTACWLQQYCRVHWAPVYGMLHVAAVCGLLDVVCVIWPCGVAKCA